MSGIFPHRRLTFSEIILIPEAFLFLLIYRIKVSIQSTRNWMPSIAGNNSANNDFKSLKRAERIAGVINGLSKRTPWNSTCLVKALAACKMLKRRKI